MSLPNPPNIDGNDEYGADLWWLATSPNGGSLILINTRGVADGRYHPLAENVGYHHGRPLQTYSTGFSCHVFTIDTSQLIPPKKWLRVVSLGAFSIFLGLNYPITIQVGRPGLGPGDLTRSNYVYTSPHAVSLPYVPFPEICRFSMNDEGAAVGFGTNIRWHWRQTPLWFIPSLANAKDWNRQN